MSLSIIGRPFYKLSVAGVSALLFSICPVSRIQADDFGLRNIAFTFDLGHKDHGSQLNDSKSSHDSFNFSQDKSGGAFALGGDPHDSGGRGKGLEQNSGGQDSGACWSDPTCGNGNHGGSACGGDPGSGIPNGGGSPAVPEPSSAYLSLLAAGAMALLLGGRHFRQFQAAKRG